MNTLDSASIKSPVNKTEDCAYFKIEDINSLFCMSNITTIGQKYTLSFWARSDVPCELTVVGTTIQVTEKWDKHAMTFTANSKNVMWMFNTIGTYYVYHAQLEIGDKATAWRPNPDDVDSAIGDTNETAQSAKDSADSALNQLVETEAKLKVLGDSIASIVRDGNGGSLLKQDSDGFYYFDISDIETTLSDTINDLGDLEGIVLDANGKIDAFASDSETLKKLTEYIAHGTDENDQPYIKLGDPDNEFTVYITNTGIKFNEGSVTPAYINNQALMIEKAEVKQELQFGDSDEENTTGVWIWKQRSNGNLGLVWKDGV